MEELAQTIENAAANVDGADITAEKVVPAPAEASVKAKETTGAEETPTNDAAVASHDSDKGPAVGVVQEASSVENGASAESTSTDAVAAAATETVKAEVEVEKTTTTTAETTTIEEPAPSAVQAVVESTTTTITEPEKAEAEATASTDAVTLNTKPEAESATEEPTSSTDDAPDDIPPVTTEATKEEEAKSVTEPDSAPVLPEASTETIAKETSIPESTPQVSTEPEKAEEAEAEQMDVTEAEAVAVPDSEPETAKPEPSTIDLDTTLDTSAELPTSSEVETKKEEPQDVSTVTIDDSVAVAVDESAVVAKEKEEVSTSVAPLADETPMEVTMDEAESESVLETPDISLVKPNLLANHNRISELVLSNGSSTPNTTNPTSVEFQETPIKKASAEDDKQLLNDTTKSTVSNSPSSQKIDISSSSSSDSGMKRLQETLKQVNGTTTTDSEVSQVDEKTAESTATAAASASAAEISTNPEDQIFDTFINVQNGVLQCLYVDRVTTLPTVALQSSQASDASSEKSAGNGSTTSLGPFALPGALTHTGSGLSVSSSGSISQIGGGGGEKTRVRGLVGLKAFLQDLLKNHFPAEAEEKTKKPAARQSKSRSSTSNAAASATPTPATPTRSSAAVTVAATHSPSPKVEATTTVPSTATKSTKQVAFAAAAESASGESQVGNFVMARWSDKKYYAGRVTAEKAGNKYVVRFEDGAQRTLTRDQLVFGDKNVASALLNNECNVLVDTNIYETGLVVSIDADACTYSVMTDSKTVSVPASDLYLEEDQAKAARGEGRATAGAASTTPTATTSAGTAKDQTPSTPTASAGGGRRKRTTKDVSKSSPEAGPSSVAEPAAKKSRKRAQSPPQVQSQDSQLSDLSDTFESDAAAKIPEISYIEAVDGVQPEFTSCPVQTKIKDMCGYRDYQNGERLGGLPSNRSLFRNKHFLLTAPEVTPANRRSSTFSDAPFDLEYLLQQLRYGGATIYEHFEEIPKAKHKSCILITPYPCLTARYIQCLAVNMVAVSHSWVIASCLQNRLEDLKAFALPAGWSMVSQSYVRYLTGRTERRVNTHPLMGLTILVSSENEDFIKFWTRVCKAATAKAVKTISCVLDISGGAKKSYLLTDSELHVANVEKAKAMGIPIVSTAWIAECLIQGKTVSPDLHENFTKANWDTMLS